MTTKRRKERKKENKKETTTTTTETFSFSFLSSSLKERNKIHETDKLVRNKNRS